jgi:hypothetical protein
MRAEGGKVILNDQLKVHLRIAINCGFLRVRSLFMEDLNLRGEDWKGGY